MCLCVWVDRSNSDLLIYGGIKWVNSNKPGNNFVFTEFIMKQRIWFQKFECKSWSKKDFVAPSRPCIAVFFRSDDVYASLCCRAMFFFLDFFLVSCCPTLHTFFHIFIWIKILIIFGLFERKKNKPVTCLYKCCITRNVSVFHFRQRLRPGCVLWEWNKDQSRALKKISRKNLQKYIPFSNLLIVFIVCLNTSLEGKSWLSRFVPCDD